MGELKGSSGRWLPFVSLIHKRRRVATSRAMFASPIQTNLQMAVRTNHTGSPRLGSKTTHQKTFVATGGEGNGGGVRAGDRPQLPRLHSSIPSHDPDITKGSNKNFGSQDLRRCVRLQAKGALNHNFNSSQRYIQATSRHSGHI